MAKIKLGTRPETFESTVTVPMPEGGEASVTMQYIYRTRTEFGAFVDELVRSAGVRPPASQQADDVMFSLRAALEATRDTNADYILKIAKGWNLDVEFDRSAVVQFCDELPGAAMAVIDKYRIALTEGRLGN